ncbi:MAG: hypothetical protein AAFY15_14965, partial [Cyanobacteria bacterium J06648_11]
MVDSLQRVEKQCELLFCDIVHWIPHSPECHCLLRIVRNPATGQVVVVFSEIASNQAYERPEDYDEHFAPYVVENFRG